MKRRILVLALTLGSLLLTLSGIFSGVGIKALPGATAQTLPQKDVYAAKFLCGNFLPKVPIPATDGVEWPVKPGNYFTTINLHNPNTGTISFQKKAVLLYQADKPGDLEQPMPPSPLISASLNGDWGLEIDCTDIRNKLLGGAVSAPTFIEGWVVIEVKGNQLHQTTPPPLDVTAVYTGHGWNLQSGKPVYEGFAEDIEPILFKRVN